MININIALTIPDHNGVRANLIYELPNNIGASQDMNNNVQLCSINALSLPYITVDGCYANEVVIERAYVEVFDRIQCISNKLSNYYTEIGKENFEILAASVAFPGMTLIGNTGVYANPHQIYRAFIEDNCLALIKRDLLSNGFRFKAFGKWYGISNDTTITDGRQPEQQYQQDRVYGFVIDSNNMIYPVNEVGAIY